MVSDNILDSEDNLVEERVTTTVKGVSFTVSAAIINRILKIANPPDVPEIRLSNHDIYTTLCPNQPFPANQSHTLSFKPSDMSVINRILWYIYSRNFIQKGGNYTHFTQKDYPLFAAFVRQTKFNLGHWIFQEMIKFKFSSRRPSHIPYPSLVSVILFYHKVWYMGPPDSIRKPTVFGKSQLNYMKITIAGEGSGESRAPSQSQARASRSRAQEAQSAPAQSSMPSDFESRVKAIVDAALASLSVRLEFEIGKLVAEVRSGNHELIDAQEAMRVQLDNVKEQSEKKQDVIFDQLIDLDARLSTTLVTAIDARDKVEKILKHLGIGSSSFGFTTGPSPKSEPVPSSSPSFTFPSPPIPSSSPASMSTPSTVILPSSTSPSTPTTEILHSPASNTPATEPFHLHSPCDPPHFEDDKGGEKAED